MNIEYSMCTTYMNVLSLFFVLGLNPNPEGCIIVSSLFFTLQWNSFAAGLLLPTMC